MFGNYRYIINYVIIEIKKKGENIMLGYYISLILTCLMLLVLPKEAFLGNQIIIIVMVMLYSTIYLLFVTQKGREFIQKNFSNPFFLSLLLLVLINIFFIIVKGTFSIVFLGKSILAFLIPSVMVYFTKTDENKFHPIDIITILLVYSIVFLKILNLPLVNQKDLTFNGSNSIIFLYIILIFIGYRKIKIDFDFKLTLRMILFTLLFSVILLSIDIICGLQTHFVRFSGWHSNIKDAYILAISTIFFVALSEEILFRGLIYNYLAQYLNRCSFYVPLVVSSIIFGFAHLINFGWAMVFLATIAGFFYGLTYIKTKNLFCAVVIHTLVNLCWMLFFVTNK
jgi:membrane protease YdiL (CAAX protease family)